MASPLVALTVGAAALAIRLFLLGSQWPAAQSALQSPTAGDHTALQEGVWLWTRGIDPYSSWTLHQPPLSLLPAYLDTLLGSAGRPVASALVAALADVLTALLVIRFSRSVLERTISWRRSFLVASPTGALASGEDRPKDAQLADSQATARSSAVATPGARSRGPPGGPLADAAPGPAAGAAAPAAGAADDAGSPAMHHGVLLRPESGVGPGLLGVAYLLNPFLLASAAFPGVSPSLLNLFSLGALVAADRGSPLLAGAALAFAAYFGVYPLMLVVPCGLLLAQRAPGRRAGPVAAMLLGLLLAGVALLAGSRALIGSWTFIQHVYLFQLTIPDLAPNLGLIWYFLLEIFAPFAVFYRVVFQVNILIYLVPLSIRLWRQPLLLAAMLIAIYNLLKPYPAVGDYALTAAVLLAHMCYVGDRLRHTFLVGQLVLYSTALAPALWYVWVGSGAGNANFFFAITLVLAVAQILAVVDVLRSFFLLEAALSGVGATKAGPALAESPAGRESPAPQLVFSFN
ncbi:hypothetical protein H696_00745 [Fonticula alba]|uniref:GPI transamidase subunit PIG-U n=1 Tax=Fonticula alba TaxID=691883 RepID=A0A058ZI50_FONAL|nr:hypothetical protein H696_00745 [Fonticula alba]KCV73202.1 hypothetical protein H696_00745 [Fonticula alba]|eukprot:XP_009492903.1 hypothetical protein H696_00745 [Fonticula alba]